MNLLANQSHDSLVYFSPMSTFHVLVPIWYVCAGFNLNCHFSHMLLLCIFCFLSKVSFGLVLQWIDPKGLVLEFRKVTKGRRGWGVCLGGMGCDGCGNSFNIQSHLKKRCFAIGLTTQFLSCNDHLQLIVFLHFECYWTSCMSCKSCNSSYIWCNSMQLIAT
jgi:hypothetical protein